jgi:hypothetical protein
MIQQVKKETAVSSRGHDMNKKTIREIPLPLPEIGTKTKQNATALQHHVQPLRRLSPMLSSAIIKT